MKLWVISQVKLRIFRWEFQIGENHSLPINNTLLTTVSVVFQTPNKNASWVL